MSVRNDVQFGGLGFYLDFSRKAWRRKADDNDLLNHPGRDEAMERADGVMKEISKRGIRHVDFFTFICHRGSENGYLAGMEPWLRSARRTWLRGAGKNEKLFDFEKPRPKFYKMYKMFCNLLKDNKLRPIATLTLRHKYVQSLMGHNAQGITSMADPAFAVYFADFARRLLEVEKTVFGDGYNSSMKIANEWSHHEREFGHSICDRGHFIADFHREMYEVVQPYVLLHKLYVDVSGSDFAKAELTYESTCPKCGIRVFGGNYVGLNEQMIAIPEYHSYSIPENLGEDYEFFLKHCRKYPKARYHEDGGGGPLALGYKVGGFRIGTHQQSGDFAIKLWSKARAAGKRMIYAIFPLETLRLEADGEYREDYRKEIVDWERIDWIIEGYNDSYK